MKKIFYKFAIIISCFTIAINLGACKREINYFDCASEIRQDVYLYADDDLQFKIYVGERETPYLTDGIKGEMNGIVEAYLTISNCDQEVWLEMESFKGQMNYQAVTKNFYLNFAGDGFESEKVKVKLTLDGKVKEFCAESVLYDGVIDCKTAVDSVAEYAKDKFAQMCASGEFLGEIYVRLLFDEKCYYYVGVCDSLGKISAYLVDGETAKIIAERQL